MAQEDDNDEYSRPMPGNPLLKFPKKPKVVVPTNLLWYGEEENPKLYNQAVDVFDKIGCELVSLNIEPLLELAKCLYEGPWVAERYVACKDFLATNPPEKDLDPTVTKIIKGGEHYTAATAFEFEYKRQKILKKINKLLDGIDAIIVPTAPLNPTIEQVTNEPIKINSYQGTYTNFVNLADMSALAIPAGFRSDGLPFGITLLSHKFNDYALLELASRYLKTKPLRTTGNSNKQVSTIHDELYSNIPKPIPGNSVKLAVVGAHLQGFELHWQLEKVDARFIQSTTTSSNYKLYALPKTGPVAKP
ncbi:Multifunctional urea amidolyase, partial [Candida maltosa Xu316]